MLYKHLNVERWMFEPRTENPKPVFSIAKLFRADNASRTGSCLNQSKDSCLNFDQVARPLPSILVPPKRVNLRFFARN